MSRRTLSGSFLYKIQIRSARIQFSLQCISLSFLSLCNLFICKNISFSAGFSPHTREKAGNFFHDKSACFRQKTPSAKHRRSPGNAHKSAYRQAGANVLRAQKMAKEIEIIISILSKANLDIIFSPPRPAPASALRVPALLFGKICGKICG